MFKDSTYNSLGVSFSDVDIFYLYALRGTHEKFIPKFSELAKSGSHLINVPGFKPIKRKSLFKDNIELIHQGPEKESGQQPAAQVQQGKQKIPFPESPV